MQSYGFQQIIADAAQKAPSAAASAAPSPAKTTNVVAEVPVQVESTSSTTDKKILEAVKVFANFKAGDDISVRVLSLH